MKINFEKLKKLDQVVAKMYLKDPKLQETKFGYAYKRFYEKNYKPINDKMNEEVNLLWLEHALEGKDKEVLKDRTDNRGYKFSKEGLKQVILGEKALIEKYNKEETELVSFVPSYIPSLEKLEEDEVELLNIFIK